MTAFPQVALDARTEILVGGTWTTITSDVYTKDPVAISRGRSDESARTDATSCRLTLKNLDGKYSPRNPLSPYYGLIGRNTPLRVSVPAVATHLLVDGSGTSEMTTPDSALLSITGDMDVRIDVMLDSWRSDTALCGKYRLFTNNCSWMFRLRASGVLELRVSQDGTQGAGFLDIVSTVPVPIPAGSQGRLALRATMDVNNGASGNTITFYTAPTIGGTWTQLGAPVITAGVAAIFDSNAPVEVGGVTQDPSPMVGRVYAFQLYSGIAGTVRANPDLTVQTPGAATFADTAGTPNTWTVSAPAVISNRDYRAHVEVSSWPPKWGTGGKLVRVPIEGAGILRRLGQGAAPLQSTMRRGLPALAPAAYWPCEDAEGSTVLASALSGGAPMRMSGTSVLATDSVFAASGDLPHLNGSTWTGTVPSYSTASGTASVNFLLSVPAGGTTNGAILARIFTTGTAARWDIVYSTSSGGQLNTTGYDAGNVLLFTGAFGPASINGNPQRVKLDLTTVGADIQCDVESLVVGASSTTGGADFLLGRTQGLIRRVVVNPNGTLTDTAIGHLCVLPNFTDLDAFKSPLNAYAGEAAGRRIARLCREEGIAFRNVGDLDDTAAVGSQGRDKLLTLLTDAAAADVGVLYEPRSVLGLGYRTRVSLYNQPIALALDYVTPGHVAPPLEPVDDDLATRNDITITRSGGSSARAVLQTGPLSIQDPEDGGVGLYDTSETVNVATDSQLPDYAGWRLHMGTWDETRYPSVHVNLLRAAALVPAASGLDVGDRLTISNPPDWLPPDTIDLLSQGFTEVLKPFGWDIVTNCSPAGPWNVGVVDDAVLGRADTDGSSLAVAATNTATTLTAQSIADGPLWTTDPAEYPFDLRLGGETVTATACTNAVTDTFTRSTSSSWGSADIGGAWTQVGTASDYSTSGTTGRHSLGSVNVARATTVGPNIADFDVVTSVSTSALATGASHFLFLVGRYTGGNDFMAARLEFTTAAAVNLTIRKRVAGTDTQLATVATGLTHVASTLYRIRFQGAGSTFRAKAWLASGTEPTEWGVTVTDASITAAGQVGVRSVLNTGNTNTLPVTATYDNFALLNPQVFTVTRSVNTVVKAQAAGTDVRLAHPMILAL